MTDRAPTERFSDRADDYARYRPSYPAAAIDAVLSGLGDPAALVAADVGAGTGISARLLADRGVRVLAIEPNATMFAVAAPHPKVEWRGATAEATGLPAASCDVVVCAQAFHWFRPAEALAEFARILRPGGRIALLSNEGSSNDGATDAYYALVKPFAKAEGGVLVRDWAPAARVLKAAGFGKGREEAFEGGQTLDLEGLFGRARSASYVPKDGPGFEAVSKGLRALHARFADAAGNVRLVYRTRVFRAQYGVR